ncbi:MAG: hypothetical protein A2540_09500 [Sulfurimonas sp. RIFOXYD2_FULL_37_8]|nr:MAG: hypothetical protein A2540_09500 [Sulfurimonas sp. RIFOXYD2_FULL_37_8]
MKLTDTLELVSYRKDVDYFPRRSKPFDYTIKYIFYANDYRVELEIQFSIIDYTLCYRLPIINFGYDVHIEEFSKKNGRYVSVDDYDDEDGRFSVKYITNKQDRKILLKIVQKNLEHYVKRVNPPLIIRGPLGNFKQHSARYLKNGEIIINAGYQQIVASYNEVPDISTKKSFKDTVSELFYIYAKDEFAKEEVIKNYLLKQDAICQEKIAA